MCGCETLSLTVREGPSPRVLENRMLVRISGPKGDKVTGEWGKLHKRNLMICAPHQMLFG